MVMLVGNLRYRSGSRRLRRHQPGHAHQVVGRSREVARQLGARQATVARPTEAADGFQPAEDFLNPFSQALTDGVPRMARGASVDGTASMIRVLRYMRRDPIRAQG